MLTKESRVLVDSFLGKTDIRELLRSHKLRELYESLQAKPYQNSNLKTKQGHVRFPSSYFLPETLSKKVTSRVKVFTFLWTTTNSLHKSVNCTLHIHTQLNEGIPNTQLLINALSFLFSFTDRDRKFKIHLVLLNDKKLIRKNQKYINQKNVNSASCKYTETTAEICVWRKEEAIKVLFHECLHGLRCSKLKSYDTTTKHICDKYNISSTYILIDEAYTELWAKILNCYYVSSLTNSSNPYQHFCTMLALEKEFSFYQANKLMKFIRDNRGIDLDKFTNVSAYYLLVAELFNHLQEFFIQCGINPYLTEYNAFILLLLKETYIPKRKITIKDKHYNTMRMSVIELSL